MVRRSHKVEELYRGREDAYLEALERLLPDVVLLSEDVVGADLPVMIRAAHQRGVPVLIIPYTIADQSEVKEALAPNRQYWLANYFNWLALFVAPHWVVRYQGRRLVRLPITFLLAQRRRDLEPPDPWMMNSGESDAIALESQRMLDYYLERGFREEPLRVTGAVYEDAMVSRCNRRRELLAGLCREYSFDPAKPLIVVSGPPNQLGTVREDCEFQDFGALCDSVSDALEAQGSTHNVLICMHPNFRDQAFRFADRGLAVYRGDMADVAPLCELFIAFASATLRWAIALGIPAINYDIFRYGYTEFDEAGGTVRVSRSSEFSKVLMRACGEPDYYRELHDRQREAQSYWSAADGQSSERVRALVDELIERRQGDRPDAQPSGEAALLSTPRPLRAVYLILRSSDCAESRRVAQALRRVGITCEFLFSRNVDRYHPNPQQIVHDVQACQALGIRCFDRRGELIEFDALPKPEAPR